MKKRMGRQQEAAGENQNKGTKRQELGKESGRRETRRGREERRKGTQGEVNYTRTRNLMVWPGRAGLGP